MGPLRAMHTDMQGPAAISRPPAPLTCVCLVWGKGMRKRLNARCGRCNPSERAPPSNAAGREASGLPGGRQRERATRKRHEVDITSGAGWGGLGCCLR